MSARTSSRHALLGGLAALLLGGLALQPLAAHGTTPPDRSRPPAVTPPTVFDHEEAVTRTLRPGVELRYLRETASTQMAVTVMFRQGSWELGGVHETVPDALGYLWDAATTSRSAEALSIEEDLAQIQLWSDNDRHETTVSFTAPKRNGALAFELLADVIQHPAFPKDALALYKRDQLNWLYAEAPNDPATLASLAMEYGWYPADEPYGARPEPSALSKLKTADLISLHKKLLSTSPVVIFAVGDLPIEELVKQLEPALVGVGDASMPPGRPRATPTPSGETLIAVDVPGADQAVIRMRTGAPAYNDADAIAFDAVNWALGGAFLSRLNANLREDKGWTYGIGSSYTSNVAVGLWNTRVMVKTPNTAAAIAEIRKEVKLIADEGITAAEIAGCWSERVADWNNLMLDPSTMNDTWQAMLRRGQSSETWQQRLVALRDIGPLDTQGAAARTLGADAPRLWVIVGDRKALEPELAKTGLVPRWIPREDAVLGAFTSVGAP